MFLFASKNRSVSGECKCFYRQIISYRQMKQRILVRILYASKLETALWGIPILEQLRQFPYAVNGHECVVQLSGYACRTKPACFLPPAPQESTRKATVWKHRFPVMPDPVRFRTRNRFARAELRRCAGR